VTSAARLALLGVAWHGEYLRLVATAQNLKIEEDIEFPKILSAK
jgi:hypothetical protein